MFLAGTDCCFGCGKDGHKLRDCPEHKTKGREGKHGIEDGDPLAKDRYFSLKSEDYRE